MPAIIGARRLHFISFEKYPLGKENLRSALEPLQTLAPLAEELLSLWLQPVAGYHRLVWPTAGSFSISALAMSIRCFAPAKNPDMWQDTLFAAMARLAGPEASFATFTAAGCSKPVSR